jgi:CDP-diacylglycerol--glycerol-3-phosphate 3-phosphatidyltransferase
MLIFAPLALMALSIDFLWLALVFMALGEFTDFLDGFVARRYGKVSDFGKTFDPLCDSVFRILIWAGLMKLGWVPICLFAVFFARDAIVSTIRTCVAMNTGGKSFPAGMSGKVKAVVQGTAQFSIVALHIFFSSWQWLELTQLALCFVAVLVTLYSLCDYALRARAEIRQSQAAIQQQDKAA